MRRILLLLIVVSVSGCYAQTDADLIIGRWLKTSKQDLIIQVYKSNDEYKGKIAWTKASDSSKLIGSQILEGLRYNEKRKMWSLDNGLDGTKWC